MPLDDRKGGSMRMSSGDASAQDRARLADIWTERAQKYGARCVLNLGHRPEDYDLITKQQAAMLFPILSTTLTGRERHALDFGCGPGRFSPALAEALRGKQPVSVVAFDVCEELIRIAPAAAGVKYSADYKPFQEGFYANSFDVIWICLVLGGLPDEMCVEITQILSDCLRPGGRLFFVDHTAQDLPGNDFWRFRKLSDYQSMFKNISLRKLGTYHDRGKVVSIIAGTRRPESASSYRDWMRYFHAEIRLLATRIARAGHLRWLGGVELAALSRR